MRTVLFGCSLAWIASSAAAQNQLTLSDAISQALANSPALQESEARVAASQGVRLQAGLKPNPRLILQSENTRLWGRPSFRYPTDADTFAMVSQIVEAGGKRARRMDLADAAIKRSELERQLASRRVASQVSLAYWTTVAAESLQGLLRTNVANFDQVVEYHRNRVREGAMAEVDLLRVQLERDRIEAVLRDAQADAARARLELASEVGLADLEGMQLSGALTDTSPPLPETATAVRLRPESQAAKQVVVQAQANLQLQRALAKTDPEVLFGYKRTAGYDTLVGGVQINLPVRNRNQGNIAAAEAEVRLAQAQGLVIERQIRNDVAVAYSDYSNRRRLVLEVLQPMRERAQEVARIANAAYREGGVDLLRFLDAERAGIEATISYLRATAELQQSLTSLRIATGEPL